ncbi:MAG: type II toxin-antitoxin system RelE/ParE family toxin [Bacteroidetes bacterium]|nr:MAG: type II toxin-antitoxin system RelE/ParE family toxin [Bacteroidota bacterium]
MYELKYLPLAIKDLHGIIDYIINILKAPKSASNLLDDLEISISRLRQFPFSFKIYQSVEPLETEYRMLPVKNYFVFYVVIENIVEIHRIIYARMNFEKIIVGK